MRTWLLNRSWTLLLTAILVGSIIYNVDGSDNYLTVDNLVNLFELSIEKIIVVVAMTFVIIAGEIDLSVASVMVLAASIVARLQDSGDVPFAVAILVALIASAAVGYTQGWLITRLGLPSLVVTLAGLITWRGVARILVEDRSYGDFPGWFDRLGQEELLGPLPFSIVFFVVLLVRRPSSSIAVSSGGTSTSSGTTARSRGSPGSTPPGCARRSSWPHPSPPGSPACSSRPGWARSR